MPSSRRRAAPPPLRVPLPRPRTRTRTRPRRGPALACGRPRRPPPPPPGALLGLSVVESISLLPRPQREARLRQAGHNVFCLRSSEVFIDLLTDSGMSALSDRQWAGMLVTPQAYAGARGRGRGRGPRRLPGPLPEAAERLHRPRAAPGYPRPAPPAAFIPVSCREPAPRLSARHPPPPPPPPPRLPRQQQLLRAGGRRSRPHGL
jgi:hypothetical protein